MSFLAPLFLGFAALVAVPIVLHLFGKDRAKRQVFAALSLLLRNHDRVARKNKLRNRALLVVRAAAILAVPFLLAKPFLFAKRSLSIAVDGPQSAVIILDDSLSMRYRIARGETLFSRAQSRALELVDSLVDSEAALLLASLDAPEPAPQLSYDRRRVRELITGLSASERATHVPRALHRAAQLLSHAARTPKRIYLITDVARHGYPEKIHLPDDVEVAVIDVTDGTTLENHAVSRLNVRLKPAVPGEPALWEVIVQVSNYGATEQRDVPLIIRVDGVEVSRSLLELKPMSDVSRVFVHHPTPEQATADSEHAISASIPKDALVEDDLRTAMLRVARPLRVLVVDGDPHVARRDDETFYLETALAMQGPGPILQTTTLHADDARKRALSDFDVVFLCNVADPPANLETFVERGGGLFVSVGDRVNLDEYNKKLGALLPRAFASVRSAMDRTEQLGALDRAHPLLTPFSNAEDQSLASVRIHKLALLSPGGHVTAPIAHESGAPLIAEHRVGKGRVLLLTTTIDRDWSSLAIAPAFLPLMQTATYYLGGIDLRKRTVDSDTPDGPMTAMMSESIPTRVEPEILAGLTSRAKAARGPADDRKKVPLWPSLGALLLALLVAEAIVLTRRRA